MTVERRELLITVVVVAVACFLLWSTPVLLPLRLLVTLVHEAGHATVAMLCGGSVQSLTVNANEGGLTRFSLPAGPSTFKLVAIGSAGYVGTAIVGGALLELCGRVGRARVALVALALTVAAIGLAWVPWSIAPDGVTAAASGSGRGDGRFTILVCVAAVVAFIGLAVQPVVRIRRVALVAVATALCLGAVEDLRVVLSIARAGGHSDASIVSDAAFLPPWFWASVWMLLGLAVCGLSCWSAFGRGYQRSRNTSADGSPSQSPLA